MCFSRNFLGFPGDSAGKECACQWRRCQRCRFNPWVRKILQRRPWQPTPVFLPEESHVHRSLVGYSIWVHKESDKTACARTHTHTHLQWTPGITFVSRSICFNSFSHCEKSVYVFSTVDLTVQREVAVSSQVFYVVCNFSRSDVFIKQETFYKVDYSVSPNTNI